MIAENLIVHHTFSYQFKIKNIYFKILQFFLYFWSNECILGKRVRFEKNIYILSFSQRCPLTWNELRYTHMLNYGWWTISPFLFTQKPPDWLTQQREEVTVIGSPTLGPNLSMMWFDSNHGSQKIRWIIVLHITKTKGCSVVAFQ